MSDDKWSYRMASSYYMHRADRLCLSVFEMGKKAAVAKTGEISSSMRLDGPASA